jgi:hypothetical protein
MSGQHEPNLPCASLVPDHKTIADFRKDNGRAIRQVCSRFVVLCRTTGLFTEASVAIDGSKFKAVNNRDKNFTPPRCSGKWRRSEGVDPRYQLTILRGVFSL